MSRQASSCLIGSRKRMLPHLPPYHYVPIPSNDDPPADVLSCLQLVDQVLQDAGGNISSQFLLMMS